VAIDTDKKAQLKSFQFEKPNAINKPNTTGIKIQI